MLECVVNVSEGRNPDVVAALSAAAGTHLLDIHSDSGHNRSVFTLAAREIPALEASARDLARAVVERVDLHHHDGAHPRFGALDVVPFVPITPGGMGEAVGARDRFARWAGTELGLPCFLYGPGGGGEVPGDSENDGAPDLPTVRREAFGRRRPDTGPDRPHPTAGACAVGARPLMLAWNLWLVDRDRAAASRVAAALRGPGVRALAFELPSGLQLSFNLVDPLRVGPATVLDAAVAAGARVARAELVGLAPVAVLELTERRRWTELDLDPSRTIEARLAEAGG